MWLFSHECTSYINILQANRYYIHFIMAFTPSIAIVFFIIVVSSIEAGPKQRRDLVVHEGKSVLV
jgi:hypothetical protein